MVTGVVRSAVVEGCFVFGDAEVTVALVAGGRVAVETPVLVSRGVCLAVPTVVCRSVGLADVVTLPGAVVRSLDSVVVASPGGFSVFWPPGRVNRNPLI